MASFVGAIESFNPYIQQIPTEAYTKVGMFKEQQYEIGVRNTQESIDKIAGLDIANEGGRQYLRSRIDELTKTLNKYSMVDFSNPNNVSQLVSLSKPLYQDENIVNDVINTSIYRKWSKEATDAYKNGKMELGQFTREQSDANTWLNSQHAGSQYTGRSTPNLSTKKELIDRIVKAKKDGFSKNEYVHDINYSIDTPYYVKQTNKYYSEADFNNFIANNLLSSRDREMLMNENWYENQGKSTEQLQLEDIQLYQSKIDANNRRIENIMNDPLLYAGDKKTESQKVIDDLKDYNTRLQNGKLKYLKELNLEDPNSRDVFHRDLSESRFIDSLAILRDEVEQQELVKNEQWFKDKELEIEAAKKALKTNTKVEPITERINEVSLYTPVDPSAPRTELSLNTIQKGYQMANDEITQSMNSLIGKLMENGVDMSQFMAQNSDGSLSWDQVQVGTKAGAAMNVPRFKNEASKQKFYNLVAGLNFAYTKEAVDGKLDNKDFTKYIKSHFTDYKDEDPNSKFTLADKAISDALNSLKGTSALLPRLENLFADKGVTRTLSQIDGALKNKKDMANAYREAILKSNALRGEEVSALKRLSDDELLGNSFFFDKKKEALRLGPDKKALYSAEQQADGTYTIYQNVLRDPNDTIVLGSHDYGFTDSTIINSFRDDLVEKNKLAGGFKSKDDAYEAYRNEGQLSLYSGISKKSMDRAEKFVKETYSYIQENLNSTVQNLKEDKPAYAAVQDGLAVFLTRARLQATPEDIQIDGIEDLSSITGIKDVEVRGAVVSNTEDIFNPNPMYEVSFTASVPDDKGALKTTPLTGRVSLKSFLATNPNYKTSEYAKYFAPALYAKEDAYARIKATVNPLEGSQGSYSTREDIKPVFSYTSQEGQVGYAYDDSEVNPEAGNQYQWETIPIERDGRQTMVSYQLVSLGQNTVLGNIKAKDQQYAPGAFYIKMRIPTSNGTPKVIFLKRPNGDSYAFSSASHAHYTMRDLIFNNSEIKFDEIDPKTGEVNYFSTDPNTIRGIFNSQLSYNGFSKLETIKLKDALGREITKQEARELQLSR